MKPDRKAAARGRSTALLGAAAAFSMLAMAAPAAAAPMSGAEKIRRLDIMLMVTGLRCRTTPDNFTREYHAFTTNHIEDLDAATDELRQELDQRGGANPDSELDRISTMMANAYGQGHPWLGCADLKQITGDLAEEPGRDVLELAADDLLADTDLPRFAYARR